MSETKLHARLLAYSILAIIFTIGLYVTLGADPYGSDTITEGFDETGDAANYEAVSHGAYAGNITEINITGRSQTLHWQGYFGEITGTLVLEDASNFTMYEWTMTEPEGEVYATVNNTPSWDTVTCFNMTDIYAGPGTLVEWENFYNMSYYSEDGINETFNTASHRAFTAGEVPITADTCPNIYTYVNDAAQSTDFVEVLLTDEDGRLIFSTIIENDDAGVNDDPTGYDGNTHDFQMLVAEDGTSYTGGAQNTDTTPYYFYLDLE